MNLLRLCGQKTTNSRFTLLYDICCCFSFFPGVYTFGLFTVDIFVNAGQVVTGNLAPYFLTVCKPNYTALGCQQALRYISHQEACTGNQDDILRARKTFPSKEAALSVYAALYLAVSSHYLSFYMLCAKNIMFGHVSLVGWHSSFRQLSR